jgi:hypothetical protein
MQAHTHKLAVDYDVFLRNDNGTKGGKVYEGMYDYEGGFNTGYYDFAHPPVREFSPLMEVDMNKGLIHEATYFNDGPADVGFGLTTADEMFITYMHYTKALPTGLRDVSNEALTGIYPNPAAGQFTVSYELAESCQVKIELFDMVGARVALLRDEMQTKGTHNNTFGLSMPGLSPGVHFVRVSGPGFSKTGKLVIE